MRKKLLALCALAFCSNVALLAQKNEVLMTVNNKPVTKSEFEAIFKKNNKASQITQAALDEYIELFVKFKLKVAEAERLGLDTIESFKNELEGYRKQLAKPYLTDSRLTDELIQEAYNRMKEEVRASHILIKIDKAQSPDDTLKAYKKALEIKKRLTQGEAFEKLAESLSDDPSAKQNNGDLGYFTGLTMVYPFESAAFNTPIGQYSDPVRTQFGYHIIKVTDKRKARGEVKVAHILISANPNDPAEKLKSAQDKINEIYALVKNGSDFADLAKKYSDDKASATNGGEMPMFGTGKMVEKFENESFALQNAGEYSAPFQTNYGWHIVKLIEKKPVPAFEELKPTLIKRIGRDDRSKMTRQSFLNKLKKDYQYKEYTALLKPFYKTIDTNYFKGEWTAPNLGKNPKNLIEFNGQKRSLADYADYLNIWKGKLTKSEASYFIPMMFEKWVEQELMQYEESQLEAKYPEFKALYKEYRDGILLFDLTNKMVWNKAVEDTAGLRAFYEKNISDYMWKQRADVCIIKARDKKTAQLAQKMMRKGKDINLITKEINKDSQLNLIVDSMVVERGNEEILEAFNWSKGVSEIKELNGQHIFVHFKSIMDAQPKKLEETRGAVTAAYQNYLEEEWIKELRQRYTVQLNREVLYSVQ